LIFVSVSRSDPEAHLPRPSQDSYAPYPDKDQSPSSAEPSDVEDCVGCHYILSQVEMDVGNTQVQAEVYESLTANCRYSSRAKIFYPVCNSLRSIMDDVITSYIYGTSITRICENYRLCRSS